ncbi:MAG: dual specificity protein phosphatase family protein [Prevotellaceae bacterium]|jgi:protein tyrosine/serine phosphatase|nr:dual specificity protein phosphatase family protein [Prevotellaceae bacterium]
MKFAHTAISGLILGILLLANSGIPAIAQRKATWAQPVEAQYVENFYKIDKGVYRSGQPSAEAFKEMEQMGIKEVLNLRNYHSDKDEAEGTSLKLYRVAMDAHNSDWDRLVEAMRAIKNRKGPIVIHCWHGSDRAGLVTALYRILFQGWTKEEALDELENGGYGYHKIYSNIKAFIQNLDVEEFKKDVMK